MNRRMALAALALVVLLGLGGAEAASAEPISWTPVQSAPGIVDLAGPRSDGRLVVSMGGGLQLFRGSGLTPFTSETGPAPYVRSAGEPYMALTPEVRLPKANCSFHRDDTFVIGDNPDRIVRVTRRGKASDFAAVPSPFLSAITFDRVGSFGHRLLVAGHTFTEGGIYAIDCRGRVTPLTEHAPIIEGGMEVAPRTFGAFAGRLIALDENTGAIWAFDPDGSVVAAPAPPFPSGGDVGVESLAFVPRLKPKGAAFLSDHGLQGAPYVGTDSILRVTAAQLRSAGVLPGDLLVATEGSALTADIRCGKGGCAVGSIGSGPFVTHSEGHIAFLGIKPPKKPKKPKRR
jgi:hypothetical protein